MSTIVYDPVTPSLCLTRLASELNVKSLDPRTPEQAHYMDFHRRYGTEIQGLKNLEVEASMLASVLNKFLTDRGFEPMFEQLEGLGVCSVLDSLIQWAAARDKAVNVVTIERRIRGESSSRLDQYPGFNIPSRNGHYDTFEVPQLDSPLVRLACQDGSSLWAVQSPRPSGSLDLMDLALHALESRRQVDVPVIGVELPMLDVNTEADVSFFLGLGVGVQTIGQAFQLFKFRMNEQGARAQVATGLGLECMGPPTLTFKEPFSAWMTQPESEIPLAIVYADTDVWSRPEGGLE
jgi:hypothetical protein